MNLIAYKIMFSLSLFSPQLLVIHVEMRILSS